MTDNTQELDELLNVLYMQGEDMGKLEYGSATHQVTAVNGAKQSILDWHNKQVEEAEKKAYQHAYMVMTDADLTEVQALDCLLKLSGNAGLIFSEAERNKL